MYRLYGRLLYVTGVALLTVNAGCRQPSSEETKEVAPSRKVMAAAASDLRFAMPVLIERFERENPSIDVEVTFGSSGNFVAQIANGAPFDLFFSADTEYPRQLIDRKLADSRTLARYAMGELVIWVGKDSPIEVEKLGADSLLQSRVHKIAIANPRHAPYGRAAESTLAHFQWEDKLRDKIVLAENVAQAAQLVQSGAADVGMIARSLATAPTMARAGRFFTIPAEAYPPIEQASVILTSVKDRAAAEKFQSFVVGPTGREILQSLGFRLPTVQ
jgi:molybdate transport system substrate-binding protein